LEPELLLLSIWDQFGEDDARTTARHLARLLPPPWQFDTVERHELGDQHRFVAFYRWADARFALIPGGPVTLGYDRGRPFVPNAAQQKNWDADREEWGWDLDEMLDGVMTPLREVAFRPFLMETEPRKQLPEAEHGFRLPTDDEWEYACAAGTRTLFRWGDDCPTDCHPFDAGPRVPNSRRRSDWDLHQRPNAFGLLMPWGDHDLEYCLAPAGAGKPYVLRGGDGGGLAHGGAGYFAVWMLLASAYHGLRAAEVHLRISGLGGCRRVFPLPADCLEQPEPA
jgi:hypothetical protein